MTVVRSATDADQVRLVRTAVRAFAADPQVRYVVPDDGRWFGEQGHAFFELASTYFGALGHRTVTDDVVALCLWYRPDHPPLTESAAAAMGAATAALDEAERTRSRLLGETLHAHRPDEPFVYVGVLATHPDWQRQGLGALLLAEPLACADRLGVAAVLDTGTPENVAWYRRFGFEVVAEYELPEGPPSWTLLRPPR